MEAHEILYSLNIQVHSPAILVIYLCLTLEIFVVLVTLMFIVGVSLLRYILCVCLEQGYNEIAALSNEIVLAHKRALELHHLYLGDVYLTIQCVGAIYGEIALCKPLEWRDGVGNFAVLFQFVLNLVEL